MSIYGNVEKGCPDCGGGPATGRGTGYRPGSEERGEPEKCAKCDGRGVVTARSSKKAIMLAQDARRNR
jgi:hypothetical protein